MARGIELDEDMGFQRGEWRVQRVGWVLMGLILVAAILGFSGGPGIFSWVVWGDKGGTIWVEGRRVERHHRPTEVAVHFGPKATKEGQVEFWVGGNFLEKMKVEGLVPKPTEMRREADRVVMVLKGGTELKMEIEPDGFGMVTGRMGVVGGEEVDFKQFLMP